MPYNIRSRNRQDQLPSEVWLHIFSFLKADETVFDWQMYHYDKPTNYNFDTLKKLSLVSKCFCQVSRKLIWKLPRLKRPITLEDLKKLVEMKVPIQEMKLSYLSFTKKEADKEIKQVVDYIQKNMHLNAFYMDNVRYDRENDNSLVDISLTSFKYCLQNLPVRNICIDCFCFNPATQEFHEYLLGLGSACPEITLGRFQHDNLQKDTKLKMDRFVARNFPNSFQRKLDDQRIRKDKEKFNQGKAKKKNSRACHWR